MKRSILFISLLFLLTVLSAQNKTWNGPANGFWSTPGNWLPAGIPGATDTVIFNSVNACDLDVNTVIASLKAIGTGGNILTPVAPRTMTINNNGAASPVFSVATGATLSMGNGNGIVFSTFGAGGANNAQVAGILNLGLATTWIPCNVGFTNITNVDITGQVNVFAHIGPVFTNSSIATLRFLSGSTLGWASDGGFIPRADYQNGSTINVTGITTTMVLFDISTNYDGLLIWNNTSQDAAVKGATAVLLPLVTYPMDSIRVVSTGLGTLRLASNASYNFGHVEVLGGTLELGSPIGASTFTASIATDLKISGGTVFVNAANTGEVGGTSGGMRITVNRDILITGGTLNLTDRALPGTFGAGQIISIGNVLQSGGLITATSSFAAQNYISLDGGGIQNLRLDNVTSQVALVITNSGSGASLQNNIILPHAFNLQGGRISMNNFDISVPSGLLNYSGAGKAITNGTGSLKILNMPANSSTVFPVAPNSGSFNPITISTQPSAATNDYWVRVETGNSPAGIRYPTATINRTWYINSTTAIVTGLTTLSFQYAAADANAFCSPTANMELGHFIPGSPGAWNLDPAGSLLPTGSNPYTVGPYAPGSIGSSFVLGNIGSILAVEKLIDLVAQKQNDKAQLNWTINNTVNSIKYAAVERSSNGKDFVQLAEVNAAARWYEDDKLLSGLNYYRVKISDVNGKVTYSSIVAILNRSTGFDIVGILPTVVTSDAILSVAAAQKSRMDIVITDMSGRQVQKIGYNVVAGSNQFVLQLANLSKGIYMIKGFTADGESRVLRFVKQ